MTHKPQVRRSHVIPKFYLKLFCEKESERIWVGDIKIQKVYVANVSKVGVETDAYAAEAGEHEDDLEERLSRIESDAAPGLRAYGAEGADVTPELGRFIAWLAARTGWVRRWAENGLPNFLLTTDTQLLRDLDATDSPDERPFEFVNVETGHRERVPLPVAMERVSDPRWKLVITQDQSLDVIRLQAYIFQSDHFPKLKWTRACAFRFVTSDRPVSWDILHAGLHDTPAALRHPLAELIVPLRLDCALVAGHDHEAILSQLWTVPEINRRTTLTADRFIYGSRQQDVEELLSLRRRERLN